MGYDDLVFGMPTVRNETSIIKCVSIRVVHKPRRLTPKTQDNDDDTSRTIHYYIGSGISAKCAKIQMRVIVLQYVNHSSKIPVEFHDENLPSRIYVTNPMARNPKTNISTKTHSTCKTICIELC